MRIQVQSGDFEKVEREYEGQKRTSFTQWAMLSQGGFVLSFQLQHYNETDVLKPGEYELDPTSFSSQNGRLKVERVKLKPVKASAVSAPAKS